MSVLNVLLLGQQHSGNGLGEWVYIEFAAHAEAISFKIGPRFNNRI